MKQIKRLTTLALAVMLLLSLAIPAFAADGDIKISVVTSASGAGVAGHTYEVYQIFTGDVAADGKTLSNVAFGKNYTPADKTVEEAMTELHAMSGVEAATFLQGELNTAEKFGELNDNNGHEIDAPTGYYLIIDVSEGLPETEEKSAYILQALENVEIMSKHDSTPKTYKKIDDKNDSTGAEDAIVWHDSADHDIGDLIDFQLNAVIPSSIEGFREYNAKKESDEDKIPYRFVFHDVEETGLTFNSITSVYVLDGETKTEIKSGYELVMGPDHGEDGKCTFDVVFNDLTTIAAVKGGSTLVVEYKSELNKNAVIGEEGNPNKMRGEYKNYNSPETPFYTPWDTVIAFTYRVNVDKYSEEITEDTKLEGANFTLYKEVPAGTKNPLNKEEVVKTGAEIKAELPKNVKADKLDNEKHYIVAGIKTGNAEGSTFDFKGIDDGNYVLVETTIPNGYNAWDAVAFTVTATHELLADEPKLTELKGGELGSGVIKTGALHTDVINEAGVELPETGGMGTTIFYALGGMMVLVAVVLLVTKKRMASAE